jgi:hypothetical protein
VENFAPLVLLPEFRVQYIECLMPSRRTANQGDHMKDLPCSERLLNEGEIIEEVNQMDS